MIDWTYTYIRYKYHAINRPIKMKRINLGDKTARMTIQKGLKIRMRCCGHYATDSGVYHCWIFCQLQRLFCSGCRQCQCSIFCFFFFFMTKFDLLRSLFDVRKSTIDTEFLDYDIHGSTKNAYGYKSYLQSSRSHLSKWVQIVDFVLAALLTCIVTSWTENWWLLWLRVLLFPMKWLYRVWTYFHSFFKNVPLMSNFEKKDTGSNRDQVKWLAFLQNKHLWHA